MDFKSSLEQLLNDRDERIQMQASTAQREAQIAAARRNEAITKINTIVEPVLEDACKSMRAFNPVYEVSALIDTISPCPRASLTFLVPSDIRTVTWPASELYFTFGTDVRIEARIWGRNGESSLPSGTPKTVKADVVTREWLERQVLRFIKTVLDGI